MAGTRAAQSLVTGDGLGVLGQGQVQSNPTVDYLGGAVPGTWSHFRQRQGPFSIVGL